MTAIRLCNITVNSSQSIVRKWITWTICGARISIDHDSRPTHFLSAKKCDLYHSSDPHVVTSNMISSSIELQPYNNEFQEPVPRP